MLNENLLTQQPTFIGKVSLLWLIDNKLIKLAKAGEEDFFKQDIAKHTWLQNKLSIPKIIESGKIKDGRPYAVQLFQEGKSLEDYIGHLDFSSLVVELKNIHSIKPINNLWWWDEKNPGNGKYTSLEYVIRKRDISRIETSNLNTQQKISLTKILHSRLSKIQNKSNQITPCLVHGDCHEGNIIVDTMGIIHLIDFGNIAYMTPEFDIARLKTQKFFQENPEYIHQIIEKYNQLGSTLDPDLIELFFTTRCTYCICKNSELEAEKYWNMLKIHAI